MEIGALVLLLGTLQVTLFLLTAARQTKRIREKYFNAVLHQPMAWFDTHQIGVLNTRLTEWVQVYGNWLTLIILKMMYYLFNFRIMFTLFLSALNSDINAINEGLGDKICVFVQFFCTFLSGVIIGFIFCWKLTLIVLAVCPLLEGSAVVWSKVCHQRIIHLSVFFIHNLV